MWVLSFCSSCHLIAYEVDHNTSNQVAKFSVPLQSRGVVDILNIDKDGNLLQFLSLSSVTPQAAELAPRALAY
ncbi:hypothetical protein ACFO3I_00005, partial [Rheinheimera marina]